MEITADVPLDLGDLCNVLFSASDTHDLAPKKSEQSKQSESETSDSESDFVPKKGRKKDKTSLRAKHSQRSSKLSSSTSSSNSKEVNKGAAVIQMSASAPSESKKTLARKEKEELLNAKMPGTVIQLQKKDSEKVEEEIHLNEGGKDGQTAATGAETLPGHNKVSKASGTYLLESWGQYFASPQIPPRF